MLKDDLIKLLESDKKIQKLVHKIAKKEFDFKDDVDQEEEIRVLKDLVEKWKKCFTDEEVKSQNLSTSLEKERKELQKLISEKEQLLQDINKIKIVKTEQDKELQKEKSSTTVLSNTVELYRKNFESTLRNYELYQTFHQDIKSSLQGIFKDESLQGFISCGVQEKNIHSLWEYIKNEISEDNNEEIEKLIILFDFFFKSYIRAYPIYEIQQVSIGETFDTELHINHSSSSLVSGNIQEILLYGWINKKTEKIVKKSIVRI